MPTSFLDPEPHHEGYIMANSISFLDGYYPNRDVFSQYGPVNSIIQGMFLKLFTPNLLSLRLLNAVLLILISYGVYFLGKKLYSKSVGLVSALVFTATSPTWTYHNQGFIGQWPWSTVIYTLSILSAALLLIESDHRKRSTAYLWLAGILLSFAVAIRNTSALPICALLIVNLFLVNSRWILYKKQLIMFWGFCTGLLFFIAILIYNNMLLFYLQDTIFGPLRTTPSLRSFQFVENVLQFSLIALALIYLITFVGFRLFGQYSLIFFVVAFLVLSFASFFSLNLGISFRSHHLDFNLQNTLYGSFLNLFQHLSILVMFIYLAVLVVSKIRSNRFIFSGFFKTSKDFEFLIIGLGFCSVFPLYPLGDIGHLWWGSPMLVTFLFGVVSKLDLRILNQNLLKCLVSSILFVSLCLWLFQFSHPRQMLSDESVFQGMFVKQEYMNDFVAVGKFTERLPAGSMRFNCNDGAFSVWNKKYRSADPNFVSWGWSNVTPIRNNKYEVFCALNLPNALARAKAINGEIVDSVYTNASKNLNGKFSDHDFDRRNFLYLIKLRG